MIEFGGHRTVYARWRDVTLPAAPGTVFFGNFRLEPPRGLFRRNEQSEFIAVAVGSRALEVLTVLVARAGEVVPRDELMASVWPGIAVEYSNLAVQIRALRRILEEAHEDGSCIQTVAGRGYRFVAPVTSGAVPAPTAGESVSSGTTAAQGSEQIFGDSEARGPFNDRPKRLSLYAWRRGLNGAAALAVAITIVWIGWNSLAHQRVAVRAAPHPSIIVPPFASLNADGVQPHFAQAITGNLATDLSRDRDIVVIPAGSPFIYGNRPVNTKQLASELGAHYVLDGSTQWSRDRVRVNVQLIDIESGANIWSGQIDREPGDDLAIESEISGRLAASLRHAVIGAEAARPTDRPNEWDYIFRGRAAFYNPSSRQNYATEILLFSRALELNRHSTEAKLYLALASIGRVLDLMSDEKQLDLDRAQSLIGQAEADAPRSPLLHFAKGQYLRARGRCEEAMIEYETVLASDSNWFSALSHLARCKTYLGQVDEAMALQEKVIRLSSQDDNLGVSYFRLGEAYLLKSRVNEAIPWLEKARVAQPAMGYVHGYLAAAYALERQPERAANELAEARRLLPWRYLSLATERVLAQEFGVSQNPALWGVLHDGLRKAGVPD